MNQQATESIRSQVDVIYRNESRRVFATLIRLIGDFDLAEEAMHEPFTAAVSQWSGDEIPANPRSWLVSTGRFKAIDTIDTADELNKRPNGRSPKSKIIK
jgi:RNA polymerase sigma-70 factor (ECF subfamily)